MNLIHNLDTRTEELHNDGFHRGNGKALNDIIDTVVGDREIQLAAGRIETDEAQLVETLTGDGGIDGLAELGMTLCPEGLGRGTVTVGLPDTAFLTDLLGDPVIEMLLDIGDTFMRLLATAVAVNDEGIKPSDNDIRGQPELPLHLQQPVTIGFKKDYPLRSGEDITGINSPSRQVFTHTRGWWW